MFDSLYELMLYLWQVEEEMRVLYERKLQYLTHLSERGAEAERLGAVETTIRKLSTKIRVAIQVVNTVSSKISQLRDEELWLLIKELISGYVIIIIPSPLSYWFGNICCGIGTPAKDKIEEAHNFT